MNDQKNAKLENSTGKYWRNWHFKFCTSNLENLHKNEKICSKILVFYPKLVCNMSNYIYFSQEIQILTIFGHFVHLKCLNFGFKQKNHLFYI